MDIEKTGVRETTLNLRIEKKEIVVYNSKGIFKISYSEEEWKKIVQPLINNVEKTLEYLEG